ncbi:hypothetical protein [Marinomonas transparens]|uniref:Lipoprotein n=1 Tax=Marinomonas transparens TaxID=2795388 RepID=A0A934N2Z0_9GAMM|nr:hypothetical protein [Marinomonas transparens]MBJ7538388.1 hypothetical protein [Marinomonas transparens]
MKFAVVFLLGLISTGCSLFLPPPPMVQESYFVPVIRSDSSSAGYTPTVTPMQQRKEPPAPRIYTPVLR